MARKYAMRGMMTLLTVATLQVTIVANGQTVVKGTSSYTVTMTGTYSTKMTTSDGNKVSSKTIDRTAFDKQSKTSTTYRSNA